jgi:predicted RNase H-like nuclease (RuvC/YqgF family)
MAHAKMWELKEERVRIAELERQLADEKTAVNILREQLSDARNLLQRVSVSTAASDVKTWRDTMDAVTAYLYPPPEEPSK